MSEAADAATTANLIVRLGLTDELTARECVYELDSPKAPAADLVQLMLRRGLLTPLQGQKLLKGDKDGYVLGGYRLLYRIAAGSFGRVYRGDDPRTGQVVAVKVLRRRWTEDARRVEHFEREGRIGRTIQHPNIVGILAVSQDTATGAHFIVMEFVEGGNLRDILNSRGKIDVDESLRIMEECVAGLAYAHSRGLTHRDIKPSNILLGTDKVAKLVDFGLAEITQGSNYFTDRGGAAEKDEEAQMDRTIDYAGLERATDVKAGDVRSDIYFLGHVLYEMIAGEAIMPRTKDKNAAMNPRRFQEVEAKVKQQAGALGLPQPVTGLICKALAFDPRYRFQTPSQFLEAIKATRAELAGEGGSTRRASGALTLYVVEDNAKLQDVFRTKFKQMGFRVLISADATNAVKRYQQAPYHAIVVDAGTAGREGVDAFNAVVKESQAMHLDLAGILMLNADQKNWLASVPASETAKAFLRPVSVKQISEHLRAVLPEMAGTAEVPSAPESGRVESP